MKHEYHTNFVIQINKKERRELWNKKSQAKLKQIVTAKEVN